MARVLMECVTAQMATPAAIARCAAAADMDMKLMAIACVCLDGRGPIARRALAQTTASTTGNVDRMESACVGRVGRARIAVSLTARTCVLDMASALMGAFVSATTHGAVLTAALRFAPTTALTLCTVVASRAFANAKLGSVGRIAVTRTARRAARLTEHVSVTAAARASRVGLNPIALIDHVLPIATSVASVARTLESVRASKCTLAKPVRNCVAVITGVIRTAFASAMRAGAENTASFAGALMTVMRVVNVRKASASAKRSTPATRARS